MPRNILQSFNSRFRASVPCRAGRTTTLPRNLQSGCIPRYRPVNFAVITTIKPLDCISALPRANARLSNKHLLVVPTRDAPAVEGSVSMRHIPKSEGYLAPKPSTPIPVSGSKHNSESVGIAKGAQSSTKKKGGRPKGLPAWNKGKSMSISSRAKISASMKQRWANQQHLKESSSPALFQKGHAAWNKGKLLNEDTRRRMSDARKGRSPSAATRKRMSESHKGRPVGIETRIKMSKLRKGKPLAQRHRDRISAAMSKRWAERKKPTLSSGRGEVSTVAISDSTAMPGQGKHFAEIDISGRRVGSQGGRLGRPRKSDPPSLSQMQLRKYKQDLREYRALSLELKTWTDAFEEKHGRKPTEHDVKATRIPWLEDRFTEYTQLRDQLTRNAPNLRMMMKNTGDDSITKTSGSISLVQHTPSTAALDQTPGKRMAAALLYKQHKGAHQRAGKR